LEDTLKNTWKAALAAAAVLGSAQIAKADLSLYGETGLFLNPTGEIAAKKATEAQLVYANNHFNDQSAVGLGLAGQVAKGLELNLQSLKHSDNGLPDGYEGATWAYFGGKYQLISPKEKGLALSLGLRYLHTNAVNDWKGYTGYLAVTKAVNRSSERAPIKATVGLRYDHTSVSDDSDSKVNMFTGIEVPLSAEGDFKVIGEFGTKRFEYGSNPWALGVRWSPSRKGISAGFGYGNYGYNSNGFFAQVGYKFGR